MDGTEADNYDSTATNINLNCIRFGYALNLADNTYTTMSNMKTCRQAWSKFIANDFKFNDKVCAFAPDTDSEVAGNYLTVDLWEYLIIDVMDGDQTNYDELFGT